jgi:hypothetical protein
MKDVREKVGHWAVRGDRISIAMLVGAERSENPRAALGGERASSGRIEGGDEPGRVSGGGSADGLIVEGQDLTVGSLGRRNLLQQRALADLAGAGHDDHTRVGQRRLHGLLSGDESRRRHPRSPLLRQIHHEMPAKPPRGARQIHRAESADPPRAIAVRLPAPRSRRPTEAGRARARERRRDLDGTELDRRRLVVGPGPTRPRSPLCRSSTARSSHEHWTAGDAGRKAERRVDP